MKAAPLSSFVAEVVRIIKDGCPWRYGKNTVVLVSERFHKEASRKSLTYEAGVFGIRGGKGGIHMRIGEALILPAPWLTDYEFEIRPEAGEL